MDLAGAELAVVDGAGVVVVALRIRLAAEDVVLVLALAGGAAIDGGSSAACAKGACAPSMSVSVKVSTISKGTPRKEKR